MYLLRAVKFTFRRYAERMRKAKLYREHGDHTKWHLVDPCFDIGDYTYGVPTLYRYDDTTRLTIGKYCSLAAGVKIMLGGNHHTDRVSSFSFYEFPDDFPDHGGWTQHVKGDVRIGNDVWIGRDAMILSGVTIGDGAVIGGGGLSLKMCRHTRS